MNLEISTPCRVCKTPFIRQNDEEARAYLFTCSRTCGSRLAAIRGRMAEGASKGRQVCSTRREERLKALVEYLDNFRYGVTLSKLLEDLFETYPNTDLDRRDRHRASAGMRRFYEDMAELRRRTLADSVRANNQSGFGQTRYFLLKHKHRINQVSQDWV